MYQLSEEQIDHIFDDISARGVKMEDLQQNILDHICCIIEQGLEANGDFEAFYLRTIQTFYKKELGEIEEETILLLTFKNYYAMKKAMIVSGALSVAAFMTGCVFKMMFWPGASILLFLGIMTMSLIFLPLLFILKNKETTATRDKLVLALGIFCGMLYALAVLFKVQHWPGANVMGGTSLFVSFFIFIPLYFFTGIRKPDTRVNTIVSTILLTAVIGLQITLVAMRPNPNTQSKTYLYVQNEELLGRMHKEHGDKLVEEIQNTCEQLKSAIMQQEIGEKTYPKDFEARNLVLSENNSRRNIFDSPEGSELLKKLRASAKEYNTVSVNNKIPVQYSILDPTFVDKGFCSNLYILNNITQLQMFVAYTQQNQQVAGLP